MIITRSGARRLIKAQYGDMPFRITRGCTIGVRPVWDTTPMLAWRALAAGADSAVQIGRLLPGNTIDWEYAP